MSFRKGEDPNRAKGGRRPGAGRKTNKQKAEEKLKTEVAKQMLRHEGGRMKQKKGEKTTQASTEPPADELLFTTIRNTKKREFLAAFASCGQIRAASKMAHVSWSSHYAWLKDEDSTAYIEAFNHAREIAGDIAEGQLPTWSS